MLTLLVPLLVALAVPSPAPEAAAPPSTLKEIGHVESLPVCTVIVVHANSAIGVALDNDRDLALVINRLRTTDLDDDNAIKRRNGMNDLSTLAGRIRSAAASGAAETKRLHGLAAQTTDATRKVELTAFTDALNGAIARQRKAATDLDKMLTIIDGRRAVEEINTDELAGQRQSIAGTGSIMNIGPARPGSATVESATLRNPAASTTPSHVNEMLKSAADDFEARTQAILTDEGTAADHALGATTGC